MPNSGGAFAGADYAIEVALTLVNPRPAFRLGIDVLGPLSVAACVVVMFPFIRLGLRQALPFRGSTAAVLTIAFPVAMLSAIPASQSVFVCLLYAVVAKLADGLAVGVLLRRSLGNRPGRATGAGVALGVPLTIAHIAYSLGSVAMCSICLYRHARGVARTTGLPISPAAVAILAALGLLIAPALDDRTLEFVLLLPFPAAMLVGLTLGGAPLPDATTPK